MRFKRFGLLLISLSYIQILFSYFSFDVFLPSNLLGSFSFTLAIASFLVLLELLCKKAGKWLVFAIILFFAIYAIAQLNFKNFMGNYISFVQGRDGITRISDYIIQFILFIDIKYYLLLLAPVLTLINFNRDHGDKKWSCLYLATLIVASVIANVSAINSSNIEKYLSTNGPISFLFHDVSQLFLKTPQNNELILEVPPSKPARPTPSSTIPTVDNTRKIAHQNKWDELLQAETNAELLAIDQFLISQNITDLNDHTGIFKDKNVITIMIEAFDYMTIDGQLTPTLYKMKTQGWFFDNY
ncbi:MAG: hypothetical protein MR210_01285, partial [Erysipelotrichaceae bacterium]|nr:hypothetical protein [Erysipelotrichaceae bacterium]